MKYVVCVCLNAMVYKEFGIKEWVGFFFSGLFAMYESKYAFQCSFCILSSFCTTFFKMR